MRTIPKNSVQAVPNLTACQQWCTQTSKVVCDGGGIYVFCRLVSQESTKGNSTRKYLCMREIGKSKWLCTSKKVVSKQTNWRISGRTIMLADSLRSCRLQGTSSAHTKFCFNASCCDEIVSARKLRRTFLGLSVFWLFWQEFTFLSISVEKRFLQTVFSTWLIGVSSI